MIRGGLNRVGENDYRYQINNELIHLLYGTSDASIFVKKQQLNYCEHLIRTPHSCIPKTLLFNEDIYKKRGIPFKSLLEQVLENESLTLDRLCHNAMMKNNLWYCLHEIDMSFSEIVYSIDQQIDRVVTTVIDGPNITSNY